MNKTLLLMLLIILSETSSSQESKKNQDVVYLKNKEVHRGTITRNEMGMLNLAVEKDSGVEILKFQHFEIDRIEKATLDLENNKNQQVNNEIKTFTQSQLNNLSVTKTDRTNNLESIKIENIENETLSMEQIPDIPLKGIGFGNKRGFERDPLAPIPDKKALKEWVREIRGFRGFLEFGYSFGLDKIRNNTIDIAKSVGFQFNPYVYLGVGTSYKISTNRESSLPIFFHPRLNMTDHEDINPFWDLKIGYSPIQAKGAFVSTSLGSSFVVGKRGKYAINVGLTYSFLGAQYYNKKESSTRIKVKEDYHQIGLTLGFEY